MSDIDENVELDRVLRAAGASWRSGEPPPPAVDPSWFAQRRNGWGMNSAIGTLAAAAVLVAVAIVGLYALPAPGEGVPGAPRQPGAAPPTGNGRLQSTKEPPMPSSTASWDAEPTASAQVGQEQVVRVGDAVWARGHVVAAAGAPVRLCESSASRLVKRFGEELPPVTCSPIAVEIRGADLQSLPGWAERQGTGRSSFVMLRGRWQGAWIEVSEVIAAVDSSQAPRSAPPCDAPQGGWQVEPFPSPLAAEAAFGELTAELRRYPDLYSGSWTAYASDTEALSGEAEQRTVIVVGAVGDLDAARIRLREIYSGNLCVIQAEYSAEELGAVAQRLANADRTWLTELAPQWDRVVVRLAVLDAEASARIGDDAGKVRVEPLVHKV